MNEQVKREQPANGQVEESRRSTEVVAQPRYRQFSREYKLRILAEADGCQRGEIGALLRRERLYASTLSKWRAQQVAGRLEEIGGDKRKEASQAREIERLREENRRLKGQLSKAEAIVEVQKKLSELLEFERQ